METIEWTPTPEWLAIQEIEDKIRDFINHPRRQKPLLRDKPKWHILTSGLDVLGDTQLAIAAYLSAKPTKDAGTCYLLMYGVLQVLFVQQDAARNIAKGKHSVNPSGG